MFGAVYAALALAVISSGGCATYTDRISTVHGAAASGDYDRGSRELNAVLKTKDGELPAKLSGDKALAALERGVLAQAAGNYAGAASDLSRAEQELELLDLRTDSLGTLGKYLYSDEAKTYKIPPTERLALNAVNLQNYLARGDLEGARVEARRFQVMRDYLDTVGGRPREPDTLGAYLAGFAFEKSNEGDRALRYYDEALGSRTLASLERPVQRLAQHWPYRGDHLGRLIESSSPRKSSLEDRDAEILVIINVGRVPHKVPERILAGAAIGLADLYLGRDDARVLKYSATKVLVYPELARTPSRLGRTIVRIDGKDIEVERLADLDGAITKEYQEAKPKILAAALTRMAARAGMAEGVRAAGREESAVLGDILALLFESALVALDRPDTRSWTLLPAQTLVARVPVRAGKHSIEVSFSGSDYVNRKIDVEVAESGWSAVVVTEPR